VKKDVSVPKSNTSNKWWFKGLSQGDIDNLKELGQDLDDEPVIYE
jgi:phosphoribosyl-AMP cyclohydrolase